MKEKETIVYKITCIKNNKIYIGVTHQGIIKRLSQHKTRPPIKMLSDIKKYGWDNFKIEEIYYNTEYLCYEKEKELISNLSPKYNSNSGGFGGTGMKGESNWCSIITEKDVITIRNMWSTGNYTQKFLAHKFEINKSHLCRIVSGEKWADTRGPIIPTHTIKTKHVRRKGEFSIDQIIKIRELAKNGNIFQWKIAKTFDTTQANISRIVNGKRWPDVGGPIKGIDY